MTKKCRQCGKRKSKTKNNPDICVTCVRAYEKNNSSKRNSRPFNRRINPLRKLISKFAIQDRSKKKNLFDWGFTVKYRDNFTCQKCGKNPTDPKNLQAHHIIPKSKDENLKFTHNNGITLCNECHKKADDKVIN